MVASKEMPAGYRLAPLREQNVGAALRIFNEHIAGGFAAYMEEPASEAFVLGLLRSAADHPAYTVEDAGGQIVGFGFLRPYSPLPVFAGTAMTTIFLSSEHTGRGIGGALLRTMLEEAEQMGISRVLAHISSRNPGSIAFHARNGFIECGRFPNVGTKWGESFDVVWMIKEL